MPSKATSPSQPCPDPQSGARPAQIAAAHCRPFVRELRARGIDLQRQLALLGISCPEQDDPTRVLSAAQFTAFLRLVEELSGDPDIGLLAGERIRIEDAGLFGLLLRSSADGRSAYEHCQRYRGVLQATSDVAISLVDDRLVCRRQHTPGVPASRTLSDYFAARVIALAHQLLGPVEPLEIRLMHPQPSDLHVHARVLGDRLSFDQQEDAVVLAADVLSRPMLHRDPVAANVLERHVAERLGVASPLDVADRARQVIREQLRHGRATMGEVASRLRFSERTLHRQLRGRGTSFQRLLDEVRCDQAIQYLREQRYSASELSSRLGFNGTAAFYRAFRRWTGSPLSAYRAEHGPVFGAPGRSR